MPFVIETWDKPGSQAVRSRHRPSHLAYLERHAALLIACGAKLHDDASDLGGGFYIVELDTREQAQAFIEGDPFYQAGLFLNVQITRWRKSYVLGKNLLTE
ncbi:MULTISPECIES: YciI family protein [unclassified Pseudomonas]|uniref:YciI family protein n=1 Tax=unclassified Pseudomonas TaxID=196821 RepID=UPI001F56F06B|nr:MULTISPECIES: YciI family protein [unclassified Pseudomonas]